MHETPENSFFIELNECYNSNMARNDLNQSRSSEGRLKSSITHQQLQQMLFLSVMGISAGFWLVYHNHYAQVPYYPNEVLWLENTFNWVFCLKSYKIKTLYQWGKIKALFSVCLQFSKNSNQFWLYNLNNTFDALFQTHFLIFLLVAIFQFLIYKWNIAVGGFGIEYNCFSI